MYLTTSEGLLLEESTKLLNRSSSAALGRFWAPKSYVGVESRKAEREFQKLYIFTYYDQTKFIENSILVKGIYRKKI